MRPTEDVALLELLRLIAALLALLLPWLRSRYLREVSRRATAWHLAS